MLIRRPTLGGSIIDFYKDFREKSGVIAETILVSCDRAEDLSI